LWLKTLYRKRAVTWPFIFYTIIWTLSKKILLLLLIYNQIKYSIKKNTLLFYDYLSQQQNNHRAGREEKLVEKMF
ncbi:hypothetical protein, partial [Enterococcus sp. VV15]|uniref:hypothetical protein n=1 Tax=Enterococcus sp. VV15 TaxID=2233541 RepID=UPI001EE868D5